MALFKSEHIWLHLFTEIITVVGSDMLLCRMFSNLVENAVKYDHPGGMVKVDVQQRDRQAVIHVADTGRGIPQEFWQSIFQPFFRVDKSLSRELGGAGGPAVRWCGRSHGSTAAASGWRKAMTMAVLWP